MKKRWRILCRDLNGDPIAELVFWFRRSAVSYGTKLASPFYDVVLDGPDGATVLSKLIPPEEFIERLSARNRVSDLVDDGIRQQDHDTALRARAAGDEQR